MDNHTKAQRSYNMSRIRSTNTQLEKKYFELLDSYRIKYRKHPKLFGKPDCRIGNNTVVFVDSDFWHGWHFAQWKDRLPEKYWIPKIERNIARDRYKFSLLKKQGYTVIRIWEHELKNPLKVMLKLTVE